MAKIFLAGFVFAFLGVTRLALADPTDPPKHVLTWAYVDTTGSGTNASAPLVRAWTNWAEGTRWSIPNQGKDHAFLYCRPAVSNAACTAVQYMQFSRISTAGPYDTSYALESYLSSLNLPDDNGFLHTGMPPSPSNRVVMRGCNNPPCYMPRLSNVNVINFVNRCIVAGGSGPQCGNRSFNGYQAGVEFLSDTMPYSVCANGATGIHFPGPRPQLPVEYGGAEPSCSTYLQDDLAKFFDGVHFPDGAHLGMFANSISPWCPRTNGCYEPGRLITAWVGHALGVVSEASVCSGPAPNVGQIVSAELDQQAEIFNETTSGYYIMLMKGSNANVGADQLLMRRFCGAVYYLSYDPARSVFWGSYNRMHEQTGQPGPLQIWPEQQIVPTQPLQTMGDVRSRADWGTNGTGCGAGGVDNGMRGGVRDLVVACNGGFGIYRREFRTCYSWGKLIGSGQCAFIVNNTASTAVVQSSWLAQRYTHSLTLNGANGAGTVEEDGCSPTDGCPSGTGTDLNFSGSPFAVNSTTVPAGDALWVFNT